MPRPPVASRARLATRLVVLVATSVAAASGCDPASRDPAERPLFTSVDSMASPAPEGSAEPNLAVAPSGAAYLSWLERGADSVHTLRVARRADDAWAPAAAVASGRNFFANWADFPSVVAVDDSRLAAHWLQRSGAGKYAYDVRVAQSADGGRTWSAGVVPHRDSTQSEHGFASLWAEGDGIALAWLDGRKYARPDSGRKDETMLVHTTIGPDGTLGAEARLDARICDCCQTSVATTSDGPVIVYRDRSDEEIRDIYVVRRVGRNWTAPAPVHRDGWKIEACPVNGPAVDARERRVAVAWFTGAGDTARVKIAFSNDGGETFGAPVRVDDGNPAGRVDVAMLEGGAAIVSWVENVGGERAEVRVRRVAHGAEEGGAREPAVTIARSTSARASGFPRMAVAGSEVLFAWTEPGATRGAPSRVRVARGRLAR